MPDDVQRVREFAVLHRRSGLQQMLEGFEQLFGAFHRSGGALQLDPAIPRGGLDA